MVARYKSVLELIWERRFNEKALIHFYKAFNRIESWNYAQLWLSAQRISEAVQFLEPKTPVLISLPNGPEFLSSFFACQMQGLWPAPIVSPEVWNKKDYLEYIGQLSSRTQIKNVICHESMSTELRALGLNAMTFQELWAKGTQPSRFEKPLRMSAGSDIGLLQFSSGSTADSKGVMLTQERIIINLSQISEGIKATSADVMATWLPFYHDMGLIGGFLSPLYHQVELHVSQPVDFVADPLGWCQHLCDQSVSIVVGPDFMYKLLARKAKKNGFSGDLSKLRVCMTGAEPVLALTCREFIEAFAKNKLNPVSLMPVYGMAEVVLGVSFSAPQSMFKHHLLGAESPEWISCGKPLPGIKIEIRNELGKALDVEVTGEIYINSPSMTVGFYKRPDLDQEFLNQNWLKTGDNGFLKDGELFITGRTKDMVIVRGRKIHAIDIENKVQAHWKNHFARVAVVTASDAATNQTLIVAIETRDFFGKSIDKNEIISYLKSFASDVEFDIYFLSKKALPRTSSGKLKRYQIREWASSGKLAHISKSRWLTQFKNQIEQGSLILRTIVGRLATVPVMEVAKLDPLKQEIEKAFREVVNVKGEIDFAKSFKDWGVDSIQLVDLLTEMERSFGAIDMDRFVEFQSLQDVHNFLKDNLSRKAS